MGTLLPSYGVMEIFSVMLVLHWLSFAHSTYYQTEKYFDVTGTGCIALMAMYTALLSGTLYPRQVRTVVGT